jgi:hypothetical protein
MVGSSPAILPRMVHRFAGRKPGLLSAVFEVPQSTGTLLFLVTLAWGVGSETCSVMWRCNCGTDRSRTYLLYFSINIETIPCSSMPRCCK